MDTLDVRGLPKEKVRYLQQLIERWRIEAPIPDIPKPIAKRKVDPSEFPAVKSRVIGSEITRAMAYDE